MSDDWAAAYSASEKRLLKRAFLEHHLGSIRAQKIIFGLAPPEECLKDEWNSFRERIAKGEPYQYVLGSVSFGGCTFNVDKHVLIPRPETEQLVFIVKEMIPKTGRFLDVGTGSGAIALCLKKVHPEWNAFACDISPNALSVAQSNSKRNELDVCLFEFDITAKTSLPYAPFDLIISNPPYIPEKQKAKMDDVVVKHEPPIALFVPNDEPLLFYARIVEQAAKTLNPYGLLAFETHFDGAQEVANLLDERIFTNVEITKDYYGHERFVFARKR